MEQLFIATIALRFCKWAARNLFKIFVWTVILGFFVWLLFVKFGYGAVLEQWVGYFLEFLGFLGNAGSSLR